jgi:exopolysaccharide production protein ExoZ
LFPLLWLATLATVVMARQTPDFVKLGLNLTGLFGVFRWNEYYAPGAWSIGNEIVFYLFFPVFIFLKNQSKVAFGICAAILLCPYLYFAFEAIEPSKPLVSQWEKYTNPFNQIFLFIGGFSIGWIFQSYKMPRFLSMLLVVIGASVFILYPVEGDTVHIVTGSSRIIFTLCCLLVCLGVYKTDFKFSAFLDRPLTLLGEASYSVYLLHPIIFIVVTKIFSLVAGLGLEFPLAVKITLSVAITLVTSYFVYEKFEKYFIKLGSRKGGHVGLTATKEIHRAEDAINDNAPAKAGTF